MRASCLLLSLPVVFALDAAWRWWTFEFDGVHEEPVAAAVAAASDTENGSAPVSAVLEDVAVTETAIASMVCLIREVEETTLTYSVLAIVTSTSICSLVDIRVGELPCGRCGPAEPGPAVCEGV